MGKTEQTGKCVGIWIRVSTEDQANGESPEHHEKRGRYYAESKNWNVIETYNLAGVSGKSVIEHPETQRMLKDVKSGRITGLIFSKLARLCRNNRELLDFSDTFKEYGADLISLQESLDTSTPGGRLFFAMIAAMAQWEREEIADRVAASVPIRAKLGKPLGGAAPFGYQYDKETRKLVPDEKEAPIRRVLFELFLKNKRKKTVARLLNEAGHRTRNGGLFSDSSVNRLLEDPIAKGTRRANYSKSLGEKKNWVLKPESDWVLSSVPAVVSEELWNSCNEILRSQRESKKPQTRRAVQLFAGFVLCTCGTKMYVPSNTPKYVCTKCRNKIPIGDLDAVFHEQLKAFSLNPEQVQKHVEQSDEAIQKNQETLKTLVTERTRTQQEMDKVYRLYIEDKISPDGFNHLYSPLETRLKQRDDSLPKLEAEIDFLKIQKLSQNQVAFDAKNLHDHWPTLEPQEKRLLVEAIMEEVIVGKDDVSFKLSYLPTSEDLSVRMRDPYLSQKLVRRQRNFTPALPFCHLALVGPRPNPPEYTKEIKTLGDAIRMTRLKRGLYIEDVAAQIGVSGPMISQWEMNRCVPSVSKMPAIIQFLGFVPYRVPTSFGQWLKLVRTSLGYSQRRLASLIGGDQRSIREWETDYRRPIKRSIARLKVSLGMNSISA